MKLLKTVLLLFIFNSCSHSIQHDDISIDDRYYKMTSFTSQNLIDLNNGD